MRVVFLYTEIAEYFLKCCEKLAESCEVHIVRWPVNNEAPFKFEYSEKIKIYDKASFHSKQLKELIKQIDPDVLVCSGWIDKDYLKVTRGFYKKIPTVMTCDTKWNGSLKQYLALVLSRFVLLNTFSHAWVPGEAQKKYALKLGFRSQKIRSGFYSCDLNKFNGFFKNRFEGLKLEIPKRFLFTGRYYNFKGIQDLWRAFSELQLEYPNDWELWCLGTGDLEPVRHPKIRHFGFVQPRDLEPIISQCSVFVLPSRKEPWGVVVQEYAASGFPLILSSSVGAAEAFLIDSENGYSFPSEDVSALKLALKKVIDLNSKELISMAESSHALAQKNSPYKWANTVLEIYYESQKK